jgi:protein AATF/BFR2
MVKKSTKGELVNQLMDPYANVVEKGDEDDAPMMDDFDDAADVKQRKKKGSAERLRRRGPLNPALSSGKYAAKPMAAADDDGAEEDGGADDIDPNDMEVGDVEGAMDAMFGLLDDEGDDERMAGIETEEQFEEWWAENKKNAPKKAKLKAKKRLRDAFDGAEMDAGDQDLMAQVEALRDRQMNVTATDDFDDAAHAKLEDDSAASQRSVMLFSKLLALRLKMQPCVTKALQLPQYYAADEYARKVKGAKVELAGAKKEILEVAHDLLSATGGKATNATSSTDMWSSVAAAHKRIMRSVDQGIGAWGHRAGGAADPKLKALNRPLLDQIEGVINGKARLLRRSQRNRGNARIFGHPHHSGSTEDIAQRRADGDVDAEVFDDVDFLKELVHRQGGLHSQAADGLRLAAEGEKEKKKVGFHRITKGRSVSYDPRPKLVAFMVPDTYETDELHDVLIASVFGGAGTE